MTVLLGISSISGSLGVLVALIFTARQTRELTRQTMISNGVGIATIRNNSLEKLHHIETLIFQNPKLQPFFYENVELPARSRHRQKAETIARMLGDVMNYGLAIDKLVPSASTHMDWRVFSLFLRDHSPIVRETVGRHSDWWPYLMDIWDTPIDELGRSRLPAPTQRRPHRRQSPFRRRA